MTIKHSTPSPCTQWKPKKISITFALAIKRTEIAADYCSCNLAIHMTLALLNWNFLYKPSNAKSQQPGANLSAGIDALQMWLLGKRVMVEFVFGQLNFIVAAWNCFGYFEYFRVVWSIWWRRGVISEFLRRPVPWINSF